MIVTTTRCHIVFKDRVLFGLTKYEMMVLKGKLISWTKPTDVPKHQSFPLSDFRSATISQDFRTNLVRTLGLTIVIRLDREANVMSVNHEDWTEFLQSLDSRIDA